jgi:hypothetical protein
VLDALALPDKSVDAAISQFGFLQEGELALSANELSRVLKDGAPFSVAAFDAIELNTLVSRAIRSCVPCQFPVLPSCWRRVWLSIWTHSSRMRPSSS